MPRGVASRLFLIVALMAGLALLGGCATPESDPFDPLETPALSAANNSQGDKGGAMPVSNSYTIEPGSQEYRAFTLDSVLHSDDAGDVHFSIYVPASYDPSSPASLFVTLPGYQGLYFQGVGENLYTEEFAFVAPEYDDNTIVVAPQLNDWSDNSAKQTIALVEAIMNEYSIDPNRVFIEGYSGGGETLSLVMEKAPELFAVAAHFSSQWDGDLSNLVEAKVPVYFAIGDADEYYGPESAERTAVELRELYEAKGLSDAEIDDLVVLDVKSSSYFSAGGASNQHGGGARLFANDDKIMGWVFDR